MWRFTKHEPSQPIRDPIEGEFFQEEDDARTARHLVRESIQNSLDARNGQDQVKVRFTFGELAEVPAFRLYAGLNGHLEADGNGLQNPPGPEDGVRFLAIEDYGTQGLTGDTEQVIDAESDKENRFFYFWRNVGRTGKGKGNLGTWGLGKTVFPASSRINSFLGLTNRSGEPKMHLMGMTVVKSHQLNGAQYQPYGYYANWSDNMPMSITDREAIEDFRQNFHIERNEGQPGFSVVIPHIVEEFTVEMLQREVTEHFFWPILKGDLAVEIQEDVSTSPETFIDREYLESAIRRNNRNRLDQELSDTIELGLWASSNPEPHAYAFQPTKGPAADWNKVRWGTNGIDGLIKCVERNLPFAVRIGVKLKTSDGLDQTHFATMYGKSVGYNGRRHSYFCRQGISVSDACATNPPRFVCLIVVDRGELAIMLSASENPSHTRFGMTDRLRNDYAFGIFQTIKFLQLAPQAIARLINQADRESDQGLLSDVFWRVADRREIKRKPKDVKGDETGTEQPDSPPPPRIQAYELRQSDDGFDVSDNVSSENDLEHIDIRAGYASASGDAIKNHSQWDFDFTNPTRSEISINGEGCRWESEAANHIRLFDVQHGFKLRVSGFDNRRDLVVTVRSRKASV